MKQEDSIKIPVVKESYKPIGGYMVVKNISTNKSLIHLSGSERRNLNPIFKVIIVGEGCNVEVGEYIFLMPFEPIPMKFKDDTSIYYQMTSACVLGKLEGMINEVDLPVNVEDIGPLSKKDQAFDNIARIFTEND